MYAIMLVEDGRIGYATYPKYATNEVAPEDAEDFIPETLIEGYVLVEALPEGDIADYRYVDGEYVYDPLPPEEEPETEPTTEEILNAMLGVTE